MVSNRSVVRRRSGSVWMNLQKNYELDLARQQLGKNIRHIPQRPIAMASAMESNRD